MSFQTTVQALQDAKYEVSEDLPGSKSFSA